MEVCDRRRTPVSLVGWRPARVLLLDGGRAERDLPRLLHHVAVGLDLNIPSTMIVHTVLIVRLWIWSGFGLALVYETIYAVRCICA